MARTFGRPPYERLESKIKTTEKDEEEEQKAAN